MHATRIGSLIFLVLLVTARADASEPLEHPYLLLNKSEVDHYHAKVTTPESLNKKFFDEIKPCRPTVPAPAPGWKPVLREFKGTPHASKLFHARRNLIDAARSAMKYLLDPIAFKKHGVAARKCVVDLVDKWEPAGIVNQYRDKLDGGGDDHEPAQFVIYLSLAYDMAYDLFSESEREQIVNWIAVGAATLGESEDLYYPEYESYPRQNHPASCLLGCGVGCLAIQDELHLIADEAVRSKIVHYLESTNANVPDYILDRGALADGRAWEGAAYGSYSLPFAMIWGKMHNHIYGGNVFAGRGIENVLEWYAHQRAAGGKLQMVEYGDDYDRYGTFAEVLLLFDAGNADGYDKWLLEYLHPGGDMFHGPDKTEQAYTEANIIYSLFFPHELAAISPTEAGARPSKYFRDFRDKTGGEIHLKNRFLKTPAGDNTVQMVLYSHRDEISKGGLAQGSLRLYAYGEKFTEEEGRASKKRWWWGSMKNFTTFDYRNPTYRSDGSLPKWEFYAQRKNPGLGRVPAFIASDFADYARADGRFPLGDPSLNAAFRPGTHNRLKLACSASDNPDDPTYCEPVEQADRLAALFKSPGKEAAIVPPYFVIVDDAQINQSPQEFRWRWHAPRRDKGSQGDFVIEGEGTIAEPFQIYNPKVKLTRLEITFLAPEDRTHKISTYAPTGKVHHQMLEVKQNAVNPVFFSILYPRKHGFERPEIQPVEVAGAGSVGARVVWNDQIEDELLYTRGEKVASEKLETDGRLSAVRTESGKLRQYLLSEGKLFSYDGTPLVHNADARGNVAFSGNELVITGAIQSGRFYAPQVLSVTLNDAVNPPYRRDGDYVVLGRSAKGN